jgi:hypothetical protein
MTKTQWITQLKKDNPKAFHNVNGEQIEITGDAYNALIEQWADVEMAKEAEAAQATSAKTAAVAKLEALGLTTDDLKALGF